MPLNRCYAAVLLALLLSIFSMHEANAARTFAQRYSLNAKGDIVFVANASMTCNGTGACATAQQLGYDTGGGINNSYTMQYIDIDSDTTTFNSSSATYSLTAPGVSQVAFAGLYWAGQTATVAGIAARNTVQFKVPGSTAYQTITASQVDDASPSTTASYQSFADVTAIVSAAGQGVYTVANIQSSTGANQYAGWSLVIVYTNSSLPTRNLVVFDGYKRVQNATGQTTVDIALTGFITPPFGPVTSKLGVVAYDGDRGSTEGTAGLLFGPSTTSLSPVSNATNPQTDVFNSSITTLGALNGGRNPAYQNTLGFDADIFAPNVALPNNATTAAIRVQTSSETIDLGVVTLATDIFVPNIKDTLTKSVTKVAGSAGAQILPGDTLEYTLNMYNAGQDGALNVTLRDPIPANTTFVPGSIVVTNTPQAPGVAAAVNATDALADDVGEFDAANNRVVTRLGAGANATQGGTLIPGNASNLPSAQMKFRVTVNANTAGGINIDNFATVTSTQQTLGGTISDVSDANPTLAGDQPARVTVATADFVVVKSDAGASFTQGKTGSYTLTVSNNGQAPGFGVVSVVENPPTGLTVTSLSGTGWACVLATRTCTRSDVLAVGGSYPAITVNVNVASDAPASVTNTAAVSCACESVAAQANNSGNDSTPITPAPVLVVTKVAGAPFIRGSNSSYTITAGTTSAGGPINAGDAVTISDNLPLGLVLDGPPAGAGWACTGVAGDTSFSCSRTSVLAANANYPVVVVPVRVGLTAPAQVTNTVGMSGGGASASTSGSVTTPVAASTDLKIAKTVSNATPNVGNTIEFTITVGNGGPSNASNVVVNDLLPSGLTFVSSTPSQGSYVSGTGVWSVGALSPAATATLKIRATVTSAASITNTASISGTEPDPVSDNNTASVSLQGTSADLSLTKTANTTAPNVGQNVSFTLTVTNNGPTTPATAVEVTDLLPATLGFVSATPAANYNAATGKWTVGSVATGTPQVLTIVARPLVASPIINKAEITKSDQFDPNSTPGNNVAGENDQAQVTLVAQEADLTISKSVDNPNPLIGETLTYTITVANAGPGSATGVVVSENVPAGLTLLNATPSQGTFGVPTWNVGTIAAGGRAVLSVTARFDGPGRVTNTAQITASDQPDPTPNAPASVTVPSQIADLSLTKSVSNTLPNAGSNVTYTVTLSNAGPDAATGVVVSDALPAGLAFVSASPSQGAYDATTGDWVVGTVANGANATLNVVAQVTGLAPITNIAEVKASREFDPDSTPNNRVPTEDDQASVTITPQAADLRLAKSVTPTNPTSANPLVTYTIRVSNSGPSAATNVSVSEVLPSGVTLNAASVNASGGTFNTGTGVWSIPSIANGASATLSFTGTVSVFGQQLTNSAQITGADQPDPTPEGAATASVLGQVADLSLAKTVDSAAPNVGGLVTFTLTASNAGPDGATGVVVRDLLPAGLSFVSASATRGTYDSASGLWSIGGLPNAQNAVLTLVARVSQTTAAPIVNRAEVSASDQFDPNSSPNNLPSGENDEASVSITPVPQADLFVAKSAPASLNPGAPASYTITVTNLGPSTAIAVTITDPTSAGLTQTSVTGSGCSALPCNVGAIGLGESRSVTVNYTVNFPATSATIANTASVSSSTVDPSLANNSTTVTTPIANVADLRIEKTGSASVIPGEFVDYTIVVTNDGPATAAAATVTDPTPSGITFVSASALCASGFPCNVGNLAPGASATVTVRYKVSTALTAGPILNTASVASSGANPTTDPDTTNNSSTVRTTLADPAADLSITKIGPTSIIKGDTISYTLTINNAGPSDAANVTIDDPVPAGITLLSVTGDCTSFASCSFASLAVGASRTVQATYQVPLNYGGATSPALIENKARVSSAAVDPDVSNDRATATTGATAPPPQFAVSKTAIGSFVRGSTSSYSIVVSMLVTAGPTTGAQVTVSDTLPSGVTLNGAPSGTGWTCTPSGATAFDCVRSDVLAAGASYPVISVPVAIGLGAGASVTNLASVDGGGAAAPASGSVITPIASSADLSIAKGVDRNAPTAAQPFVVFTLTAENAGPSTAVNTNVQDLLPSGMTFVSATPSLGTYSAASGTWALGDLAPGTRATLAIRAQVTDFTSTITNTATISSATTDPLPGNDTATATLRGQEANLSLTKTVVNASPNVRSEVDFSLTVSNAGPNAATNVEVTDLLPVGLAFVSATPTAAYNASSGVWSIASIASGTSQILTIRARVTSPQPILNTAEVTRSDQFDPTSTPGNGAPSEDDFASVLLTPQQSDLRLAKSVDNPNPLRGDVVTYTVEVSNLGPSAATNIIVSETLPAGIDFTAFVPSAGVFNAGAGNWQIAQLPAGASATLTLAGVFRGPAAQTNTAQITSLDQFDPTPNTPVSVTVPSQIADLSLTKSVDVANPVQGSNVVFTIRVANAGPDRATGVAVNDLLPTGLEFVSATVSAGSYDSASGEWTVGGINASANATLTLTARVTSFTPIVNTARVSASQQYDPNSVPNNNDASENDQASQTITPRSADLKLSKRASTNAPSVASPNVSFTIDVFNAGPDAASGVTVRDALPAGMTLVSATPTAGAFAAPVWTIPTLAANARATLTVVATVTDFTRPITNTAQITGSSLPDPTPNEQASATVQGQVANLSLTKTVDQAAPRVGANVVYTLTVNNVGPDAATNVSVTDALPVGLALVSVNASQGSYDPGTGLWSVGTVANAANATLTITARVAQTTAAPIVNRAEIRSSDQFDPNSTPNNAIAGEDDQAQVNITPVPVADVTVAKIAPAVLNPGTNASYRIIVKNLGPSIAQGVQLADPGPAGLTLVNSSCGAFPCAIGTLQAGESREITVVYRVPFPFTGADPVVNVATVTATTFDPDLGNNTETVGASVDAAADLQLVKTGPASVVAGTTATYTITVTNAGPSSAGNVVIDDPVQPGIVRIASVSGAGCSALPCNVGSIAPRGSVSITVNAVTDPALRSGATLTNVATVSSTTPDPNLLNNAGSADSTVGSTSADIRFAKTGPASARPGDTISFTITVQNLGPSAADSVTVTDPSPANFAITGVSGDCTALPCSFVSLPVGVTRTITVTGTISATAPANGAITNTATVTTSTPDPTPNPPAVATVSLSTVPDLTIALSLNGSPVPGVSTPLTITVSNAGGAPTNAPYQFAITPPPGALVSGVPPGFTCSLVGASYVCIAGASVPPIAPGSNSVFTVQITFPIGGAVTVAAEVAGGGERNTTNNTASVTAQSGIPAVVPTLNGVAMCLLLLLLVSMAWRFRVRVRRDQAVT